LVIPIPYKTTISAITSLLLWSKFLYFLRIFESTGYLIRMIIDVVSGMKVFLFVLILVLAAFADAFISMSDAQTADFKFAGDNFLDSMIFTYRLGLGDMQISQFADGAKE
jgi:hypothetical protein